MKKPYSEIVWEWAKAFVVAICLMLLVRYFVLLPLKVEGDSMAPALEPDSYILYDQSKSVERFDIILFHDDYGMAYIKRVIGLPGETVSYQNDHLYINGEMISEPFLEKSWKTNQVFTADFSISAATEEEVVPVGHYFVLGDNRPRSKDSRMFGFVPVESIEGQARMTIYPLDQLGWIQ